MKALKGHFGINSNQSEELLPVPSTAVAEETPAIVGVSRPISDIIMSQMVAEVWTILCFFTVIFAIP